MDQNTGKEAAKQVLGYTGNDNILEIKFTPVTTLALQGKGMIEVTIPHWFKSGTASGRMYTYSSENMCFSNQMRVSSSKIQGGSLKINYFEMESKFLKDEEIIIKCK